MIHEDNLKRLIRVRNILTKRRDKDNDFLGVEDIGAFKEEHRKNNMLVSQTIVKIGPPSFIKTKFKLATAGKMSDGNYFGLASK